MGVWNLNVYIWFNSIYRLFNCGLRYIDNTRITGSSRELKRFLNL